MGRELVEDFYYRVWNGGDEQRAHQILAPELEFRASLDPSKSGLDGFFTYLRLIRGAFSDYECRILDLICEHGRCFARLQFRGRHTARFMNVDATQRVVAWQGAALFDFQNGRVQRIWAISDVDELRRQLHETRDNSAG